MVRWEPNARERLQQAALDLYAERGFEQTTAAAIAERAGLTERTFFRHFADKREVLFSGALGLQDHMVAAVRGAPAGTSPIAAIAAGVVAAGDVMQREFARKRQAVIASSADLRERELIKLALLAEDMAVALRERGVADPAAALAADAGIAVFRAAFWRWIAPRQKGKWDELARGAFAELASVTASPSRA